VPGRPKHPVGLSGTVAVAGVAASLATLAAESVTSPGWVAVGAVCYSVGLLGVWAAARRLFYRIDFDWRHALWAGISGLLLAVQWTLPVTAGVVVDSVVTPVWLFAATGVTAWTFFRVGGEGSILFVWPLALFPVALAVLLLLLVGELVVAPQVAEQFVGPAGS